MKSPAKALLPSEIYSRRAFEGRVYVVTGAARGIGACTVRELIHLGASVVAIDLNRDMLKKMEADLSAPKGSLHCLKGDVSKAKSLERAVRVCGDEWGRLDGWVNNALLALHIPIDRQKAENLIRCYEVNVVSAWESTKLSLPLMRKGGGGSIVNISSVMSWQPANGAAAYASTKAGLEGLTRALAIELAPAFIRVNSILPGAILTRHPSDYSSRGLDHLPARTARKIEKLRIRAGTEYRLLFQPMACAGMPEDIAGAILFLLSDASRFVTGASLVVDGGSIIWHRQMNEEMWDDRRLKAMQEAHQLRKLLIRHRPRRA